MVPPGVEVKTGAQAAADQTKQVSDAIGTFLKPALLSFGGIAVLVGAFIIFNAFSMTVAQRRREFAMVRALGASRRQVLVSVTVEALAMGVFASLLGMVAGLGVAAGVNQLFQAIKVDIPHSGLVLAPRTIVDRPGRRRPRDAALGGDPRDARDARPAHGRPAGRGRAAAVAVLALHALRGRGRRDPGRTLHRRRHARARRHDASGWARSRSGRCSSSSPWRWSAAISSGPIAGALGWPLQKLSPVSGRLARDNSIRNPGARRRRRRPS